MAVSGLALTSGCVQIMQVPSENDGYNRAPRPLTMGRSSAQLTNWSDVQIDQVKTQLSAPSLPPESAIDTYQPLDPDAADRPSDVIADLVGYINNIRQISDDYQAEMNRFRDQYHQFLRVQAQRRQTCNFKQVGGMR